MDMDLPPLPHSEPAAEPDARLARQLEMLADLAEIGLALSRAIADHARRKLADSAEGWAFRLPINPGADFAKIAQCVRRTIALEVHLREGKAMARAGLFAAPDGGINLHPAMTPALRPKPADRSPAEASPREPRETIAGDLGRLLDDRERLLEYPVAPTAPIIGKICEGAGLDPRRLAREDGVCMVKADPADPAAPTDTPLKTWRPVFRGTGTDPFYPAPTPRRPARAPP
jgi:hypothetical protein